MPAFNYTAGRASEPSSPLAFLPFAPATIAKQLSKMLFQLSEDSKVDHALAIISNSSNVKQERITKAIDFSRVAMH